MTDEVTTLAVNLAGNCGYQVLPCRDDKRPVCPHGFKDASNQPETIADLWRRFPGPLIGIATGAASGIDVLDVDVKHDAALAWWSSNQHRIPPTRSYRTRAGGLHLHFVHATGLGCSAGKPALGIDVRGDGGYVIHWFAAGLPCLDHSPPVAWPEWLLAVLLPKPKPERRLHQSVQRGRHGLAIEGIVSRVAVATEGERNNVLHWGACRLGQHVLAGHLGALEAEEMVVAAGVAAGLGVHEARRTARSGLGREAG